ncbi:SDR family NAD(P)-dependent oxidoreductase [Nocardia abscessus]|uniref:SDR family NAD(P)-dependent oxidoreductase n=1 Tax=Nocardia abscessus TaxID=120957 RepID=UPI0024581940|nr:SDR family NAD(P)-dependent oxidoreductase [Nocardia abscessus]
MTTTLDGRVAVVTGAASGIGAGIATVLARAGARVVVADRDAAGAESRAEQLRDAGHEAEKAVNELGWIPEPVELSLRRAAHFLTQVRNNPGYRTVAQPRRKN